MRRLWALIGFVVLLIAAAPAPASAETRNPRSAAPIYLVMDVSGSMDGARIEAAKGAALGFIKTLQPGQIFALYTFPGGKKIVDGCSAGRFVVPPSRIDTTSAGAAVRVLSADGATPTVPALKEVLRSIDEHGYQRAQVVLVTDGEANCGDSNDVCSIVPLLDQRDVDLRIHTVSLNNTPTGDASLACLAQATGGESTTVDDSDGMIDAIREASSYVADLTVELPQRLSTVTGSAASLASRMTITATATGSTQIPDARLVISFNSGSAARHVRVPSPIHTLGNLDPDTPRTVTTSLYPNATATGPTTWTVSLHAGGVPIAQQTGTVEIVSSADIATAGSILTDADSVVIMGDSYSSGEGAGDYATGSTPKLEECHRSVHSSGKVLFPDAQMIACSGALATNLFVANPGSSGPPLEPQLLSLLKTTADGTPPDLVMLTLGGNDAGFASVVQSSVYTGGHLSLSFMYRTNEDMAALQAVLRGSYNAINQIVNSKEAVISRRGEIAQILVLAYALGIPPTGHKCFLGVNPDELYTMYGFGLGLNHVVRDAVRQAQADGVPVHYVATVEDAFQPNHTMCDADSYLRTELGSGGINELMHPTKAGQRAIAQSVIEWSRGQHRLDLGSPPADYRGIPIITSSWSGWHQRRLGDWGIDIPVPWVLTEPGSEIDPAISCSGTCKWGEGVVTVTLQSAPVPLGALRVPSTGAQPVGSIQLPLSTEPGRHTLVFRGVDAQGNPIEERGELTVWRAGTNRGLLLSGLGAIVLLGSSIVLLATGKTPRERSDTHVDPS